MAGIDRSKFGSAALAKKAEESFRKKDDSGKFKDIFDETMELKKWKCKEGDHILDIIPYLASENHPNAKAGEVVYILDIWVHYGIGVNENAALCMARTYNKPCPICELANALRKRGDVSDEVIKKLAPKRRAIYNIMCYDSQKEIDTGVQIWDASHYLTEKNIIPLARNPRGGGFIAFADIDNGMSISFTREGSGQFNTNYAGYRFVDRDYIIEDDVLQEAVCLEDCIIIPDYEALKEEFMDTWDTLPGAAVEPGMGDDVPLYNETPPPARGGRRPAPAAAAPASRPAPAGQRAPAATKPAASRPAAAKPAVAPPEDELPEDQLGAGLDGDPLDDDLGGLDDGLEDGLMNGGEDDPLSDPLEEETPPPAPTQRRAPAAAPAAGGTRKASLRPTRGARE